MLELTIETYNHGGLNRRGGGFTDFTSITHAGDPAPDFTLPLLDGREVTLSKLRGKPVVIEFGFVT